MKFETAYPTLGEFLRGVSIILESKPIETNDITNPLYRMARNLDRLADDGDFDYTIIKPLLDIVLKLPFTDHPELQGHLNLFGQSLYEKYIDLIKNFSLAGFNRKQSLPWLINYYAADWLSEFIIQRQVLYMKKLNQYNIFESEKPISSSFKWLEKEFPKFKLFLEKLGTDSAKKERRNIPKVIKSKKDKYRKWINGNDCPRSSSLWSEDGILTLFFKESSISQEDQNIINETFYFSKILHNFYTNTKAYNSESIIRAISRKEFQPKADTLYLRENLKYSMETIELKSGRFIQIYLDILASLVNRTTPITNKMEILKLINQAEIEAQKIKNYSPFWWEISRFKGMWHVFNNKDFDKAIPHYVDAVNGSLYSGSKNSKKVLREAICLCSTAYQKGLRKSDNKNLKSIIKRLKNQGMALGFHHPWICTEKDITELEIKFSSAYFWQYFPSNNFF